MRNKITSKPKIKVNTKETRKRSFDVQSKEAREKLKSTNIMSLFKESEKHNIDNIDESKDESFFHLSSEEGRSSKCKQNIYK